MKHLEAAPQPAAPPPAMLSAAASVRAAIADASRGMVGRESMVELVALCAVAGEHLLVIGPPGTGKSEAVRRIARRLGGTYFEYLIGRFTEPNEIFGPINLHKLKAGTVETDTAGMLPEADVAFLDEIFLGSTAILNTLLGILNERTFRRGHTSLRCPLRVCVAAANRLPEDEQLAAFADRFLVRNFVEPIHDSALEDLLSAGWSVSAGDGAAEMKASPAAFDALQGAALAMDLAAVRPTIAHAVRLLRAAGIALSDRRIVRMQRLFAAAATLAGRTQPSDRDLWPIIYTLPSEQAQQLARDVLRDILAPSENAALLAATAEGSLGARARGARLLATGLGLLQASPSDAAEREAWKLRLESVARELDATFAADALPPDLSALRGEIVNALG